MVKVKICGMMKKEDIDASAGADLLGFVVGVPKSHRNLEIEEAAELVSYAKASFTTVVVTTNIEVDFIRDVMDKVRPDIVQIHKPTSKEERRALRRMYMQMYFMFLLPVVDERVIMRAIELTDYADLIILDTPDKKHFGGSGKTHNWGASRNIIKTVYPFPVFLAGGLTPKNVEEAVKLTRPYGVDVSSGVETKKKKDPEKIRKFIETAKRL